MKLSVLRREQSSSGNKSGEKFDQITLNLRLTVITDINKKYNNKEASRIKRERKE